MTITVPDYELQNNEGKEFAIYPISVQQAPALSDESLDEPHKRFNWTVHKGYSEFFDLNQTLKFEFGSLLKGIEPPAKSFLKLKRDDYFLEIRRQDTDTNMHFDMIGLEKYIQQLSQNRVI